MGDELNDSSNVAGEFRRKRPVPIFTDRYIERPYMRKEELSLIRDNLETLVDIKAGSGADSNLIVNKVNEKILNEKILPEVKDTNKISEIKIPEIKIPEIKIPEDVEIKSPEIKIPEIKIGIGNLVDNKNINKQTENKQTENKQIENKSKKRKVISMDDENVNVSPEIRRQLRKAEFKDMQEESETNKAIRRAAELAEQNKLELEQMKKSLASENAEIRKDLKNEFGNKFGELSDKFNDISGKFENVNGKFEGVSKKLEETCTGIDCLKKDMEKLNKNVDLVECPECNLKVVPPLASYCPNCSAKMTAWNEDDGTPIKGWKPSWQNNK